MPSSMGWTWITVAALAAAACSHESAPAPAPSPTVSSVVVSGAAPSVGASVQFSAFATLSDGSARPVTAQSAWSSSNTSVATVNDAGAVKGVAAGEVDVTATYQNVAGRAHVTIAPPAPAPVFAIGGTVTDGTSGGILPDIDVQAVDSTGHTLSTKTSGAGTYAIGGLTAGAVAITASAVSYQTTVVAVSLASDNRVDIVLPRVMCLFSVSPASVSLVSGPSTGTVTVTARDKGCTWTATSNDPFLTITSGASGLNNGVVSYAVAPNPIPLLISDLGRGAARSGTLTVAGTTVAISQNAPRRSAAAYDPVLKAPVCQDVGEGCESYGLLVGAGPSEPNQPNTIFNACPDGSGSGSIHTISIATPDGTPLTAGRAVRIVVSSSFLGVGVFIAADAMHPVWVGLPLTPLSHTLLEGDTILPAGAGLQAVRAIFGQAIGPGPCATGPDVDNDDLVFRVQ
jgi:Bacterial Ig-like domain (group 2)/Carboxypeptidase regulatory-like domain